MIFILNYQGTSLTSNTIKFCTWSSFSHTAIAQTSGLTVEAWHIGGVALAPEPWHNHTPGTPITIYGLAITTTTAKQIWQAACAEVGKAYDFRALTGFNTTTRWLWRDDPEKWFCSHLTAHACKKGGGPLFSPQTPLYKISPGLIDYAAPLKILGQATDFEAFKTIITNT